MLSLRAPFLIVMFLSFAPRVDASDIGVPSLGFVYDKSAMAIRSVLGTPGAAVLGTALDAGFPIASAATAARQRFALAMSVDDGQVHLLQFQNGRTAVSPIGGALTAPDRMILSPSGRAAILLKESAARLQVITGLPDAPAVSHEFNVADLGSIVTNPAVSDDGSLVVIVTSDAVAMLSKDAGVSRLPLQAATVSFRASSRDALAAGRTGELYLIRSDGSISQYGLITIDQSGEPVAAQLSSDGKRAFVVYSQGAIAVLDSTTGAVKTLSCGCAPTGLHPVTGVDMFRLNEPSALPMQLLDVSAADPRVLFIPPDRTSADDLRGGQ